MRKTRRIYTSGFPEFITNVSVLKRWKDLTKLERHREIIRIAGSHDGKAVTLNLGQSFTQSLLRSPDPMRLVGKRMNAELNARDWSHLPVLLVLEATREHGRPHLHGVFISNGIPNTSLQSVMRQAVGRIPGRSGSRQFLAKQLYKPDGWTCYVHKDHWITRKLLSLSKDLSLTWVSHPMTQFCRQHYEVIRLGRMTPGNINAKPVLCAS
jgi:hypothetical protein